jgi:hypothetical protein
VFDVFAPHFPEVFPSETCDPTIKERYNFISTFVVQPSFHSAESAIEMDRMQRYHANDNVTLKYIDTGAEEVTARGKPWLILVRLSSFRVCIAVSSLLYFAAGDCIVFLLIVRQVRCLQALQPVKIIQEQIF